MFRVTTPSSNPFGSPSVFAQNSNTISNPFTPKPFGSTTPFGSPTGASVSGGTSTGVFGANSSALGSTPAFGAPSFPAFGSSTAGFGAPSTSSFGSSPSSFGGSSVFGQNPAFGGFASRPNPSNSSGSAFQQTQTTLGGSPFSSSTPLGASTQNAFGAASAPAFGATSISPFGVASTPAFGSSSTSTSTFGSTGAAFGFGMGGAFCSSSTLGASNTSAFGASNTSAFGASSSPAFGTSSTTGFGFRTTPIIGQSTSVSRSSSLFGATSSLFGTQSSSIGAQTTTQPFGTSFGPSAFGRQHGGSRVAAYTATAEVDGGSRTQTAAKLQSLSAMAIYKDKNHEELRWEDYQSGDKGGPCRVGQSEGGIGIGGFTTRSNSSGPSPTLSQSSANLFSYSTSSNPFTLQASSNPFATQTSSPNPFFLQSSSYPFSSQTPTPSSSASVASSVLGFSSTLFSTASSVNPLKTTSSTPSPFLTGSAPAFGPNRSLSLFSPSSSPAFGPSPSFFSSTTALRTPSEFSLGLNSANTQSSPVFHSFAPSLTQTNSLFAPTTSFGPTTAPPFSQPSIFSAPSIGSGLGGNLFSSTPSLLSISCPAGLSQITPSLFTPLQPSQAVQTTGAFASSNFPWSSAGLCGFVGIAGGLDHSTVSQRSATQSTVEVQPAPVASPFGAIPAMSQLSIGCPGSTPTIQYGISSMPVFDKPATPVRLSSLLTSRHLSHRRIGLPIRKYDPKSDGPKVPFFSYGEEAPTAPTADAPLVPRENPRALVVNFAEQCPQSPNTEKKSPLLRAYIRVYKDDNFAENGTDEEGASSTKSNHKPNGPCNNTFTQKGALHVTVTSCKAGEDAILEEHGTGVDALMPQLQRSEYYTEPRIQELAVKERAEPGFCCHVKDFVVGRHGYGSIKFLGETDVRQLDLDSDVQFNNREVIVYMNESKKPPVGQGLNKPAVVTLLNINCIDKKTGKQYTNGPKVDKYREMLIKKAAEQGAEFVSYDAAKGEWKFKVHHFSRYEFRDDKKWTGTDC